MRRSTAISALVALTATTVATVIALVVPSAASSHGLVQVVDPGAAAGASADAFVASDSSSLRKSPGDRLVRTRVHPGTNGLQYVAYERVHRGMPVVGGDLVVVTD